MNLILIAALIGLSASSPSKLPEAGPPVSPAHAARVRLMLQNDGTAGLVDAALKRLREDAMRAAAESRHEPALTADETLRFDRVSKPVLVRLERTFTDEWAQYYAALSDAEIDDLIRVNDTPLGRRFIARMVQSEEPFEITSSTYATETAAAISLAYADNASYAPKGSARNADAPEDRLLIETGNAAMTDEAIDSYLRLTVASRITGVDFDRLSDSDRARLLTIYGDGLRDLGHRMKALRSDQLRDAFSQSELKQLVALYALPALQTKTRIALAAVPDGRKHNFAAWKAAFDEILAAFAGKPQDN